MSSDSTVVLIKDMDREQFAQYLLDVIDDEQAKGFSYDCTVSGVRLLCKIAGARESV